ncbi:hypothetical protein GLYMA_11G194550v4 [Glycine max]|nr:hypothetical protein GLYMA_11G194550v4 [Glycine max]KAH1159394.1 hypothetical protein GYH30_031214 [Glycine max]
MLPLPAFAPALYLVFSVQLLRRTTTKACQWRRNKKIT